MELVLFHDEWPIVTLLLYSSGGQTERDRSTPDRRSYSGSIITYNVSVTHVNETANQTNTRSKATLTTTGTMSVAVSMVILFVGYFHLRRLTHEKN